MKMTPGTFALVCATFIVSGIAPALAQDQTMKACRAEWQAHKADNQAKGITEKAFIDQCRGAGAAAKPETTPVAAKPAPTAAAPVAKPTAPAVKPAAGVSTNTSLGPNQFPVEALAKAHCPADTVVWVDVKAKIYHFDGSTDYGTTKDGAYVCEKEAIGQGVRAAKNEKHPA
jgi:hypothetical protein